MSAGSDFRDGGNGDSPHFQLGLLDGILDGEDGDAAHRIRTSARARRLSIRVYPDARVEVVVPPRASPREIERFITAHRQWIDDKRALALKNRPAPQPFPPEVIEFGATGERFRLQVAAGSGRLRVQEMGVSGSAERVLRISGVFTLQALRRALRSWLLEAARKRLEPQVARLAATTGVKYSRVSSRRQRSRWGSCSVRGTISLNCCLLFQRPEVVEYLIVHELMHVRHMNHSPRFWQAVENHCADWRRLDQELVQGWRHVPRWVFLDEERADG